MIQEYLAPMSTVTTRVKKKPPTARSSPVPQHAVYLLRNGNQTYLGYSNNWRRRLRQHNCEISGGARYTRNFRRPGHLWEPILVIAPLPNKREGLSLEWWCKHANSQNSPYRVGVQFPPTIHEPLKQGIAKRRFPGIWKALYHKGFHTSDEIKIKFFDSFFAQAYRNFLKVSPEPEVPCSLELLEEESSLALLSSDESESCQEHQHTTIQQ